MRVTYFCGSQHHKCWQFGPNFTLLKFQEDVMEHLGATAHYTKFSSCTTKKTMFPKGSSTSSWNFGSVKIRPNCYHFWRFQNDVLERLAIISHNSFRAIGVHKSRYPSSPYVPAPQGSQLITLVQSSPVQSSPVQSNVVEYRLYQANVSPVTDSHIYLSQSQSPSSVEEPSCSHRNWKTIK